MKCVHCGEPVPDRDGSFIRGHDYKLRKELSKLASLGDIDACTELMIRRGRWMPERGSMWYQRIPQEVLEAADRQAQSLRSVGADDEFVLRRDRERSGSAA